MYIEFVIGYILTGVLALLLTVVIVLQCIILRRTSRIKERFSEVSYTPYTKGKGYAGSHGTAICRNCATQFDAGLAVCPKCGVRR